MYAPIGEYEDCVDSASFRDAALVTLNSYADVSLHLLPLRVASYINIGSFVVSSLSWRFNVSTAIYMYIYTHTLPIIPGMFI